MGLVYIHRPQNSPNCPPIIPHLRILFYRKNVRIIPICSSAKKLRKGFDFLGYQVLPGRRLRSSAESKRRFAEKFRRLYEQEASSMRLWRYAQRWCCRLCSPCRPWSSGRCFSPCCSDLLSFADQLPYTTDLRRDDKGQGRSRWRRLDDFA